MNPCKPSRSPCRAGRRRPDELPPCQWRHPPCRHLLRWAGTVCLCSSATMHTRLIVRRQNRRPSRSVMGLLLAAALVAWRPSAPSAGADVEENGGVLDCVRGRRVGLPRNVGLRHAQGCTADTHRRRSVGRVLDRDRRWPAGTPGPAIVAVGRTRHTWRFHAGGQGTLRHGHDHASRLRHGAGRGRQGRLPEWLPDRDVSGPAVERQRALPASSRLRRSDQGQSGHSRLPSFPFTAVPLQAGAGGALSEVRRPRGAADPRPRDAFSSRSTRGASTRIPCT